MDVETYPCLQCDTIGEVSQCCHADCELILNTARCTDYGEFCKTDPCDECCGIGTVNNERHEWQLQYL